MQIRMRALLSYALQYDGQLLDRQTGCMYSRLSLFIYFFLLAGAAVPSGLMTVCIHNRSVYFSRCALIPIFHGILQLVLLLNPVHMRTKSACFMKWDQVFNLN